LIQSLEGISGKNNYKNYKIRKLIFYKHCECDEAVKNQLLYGEEQSDQSEEEIDAIKFYVE
jgi:hypothetical protein